MIPLFEFTLGQFSLLVVILVFYGYVLGRAVDRDDFDGAWSVFAIVLSIVVILTILISWFRWTW